MSAPGKNPRPKQGSVRVAVVGYGYWGQKLMRVLHEISGFTVVACCTDAEQELPQIKKDYPSVSLTTRFETILADRGIDAVVIATPLSTHFSLSQRALAAGKHVFVEKPLTTTGEEAQILVNLADQRKKILFVDHTYLYSDAVRTVKRAFDAGQLGTIWYVDSVRVNIGLFRKDCNVVWDLASHDISILSYVLSAVPQTVSVFGLAHLMPGLADTAYLHFAYSKGFTAHVSSVTCHVSKDVIYAKGISETTSLA